MIAIKNYKNEIKEHVLIIVLFLVLTLILTYPVITRVTTHAAGDGGDGFQFKWNIWHVNRVLTEGGSIFDFYRSDLLFYPHGANLQFHTLSLTNTLFISFPLTLVTDNLVFIYNTLFFLTFIMAGYAMYLLAHSLAKDRAVAFLVGFAYAFSPLHMARGLGHLNLMSFQWTPFFFLFFFKMFEEEKMRNAVIAAIFLFFSALACWHHLLFAFLIAVPYFIYKLITARHLFTKCFFIRMAVFLILFGIIILPFLLPIISYYFTKTENIRGYGADTITAVNYFLPSTFHPLLGERVKAYYPFLEHSEAEIVVTLGYLTVFISLLYLLKTRKNLFWFLLAGFFFLISLIPWQVILILREYIPFLEMMGHTNRFSFGVLFSLLIFFTFALTYFLSIWKQKIGKLTAVAILFFILAAEYFAVPYPTTYDYYGKRLVVEFAEEIGRTVKGPHPVLGDNFTVLNLPLSRGWAPANMYLQKFHQKPIIEAAISRSDPEKMQTIQEIRNIVFAGEVNKFQVFLKKNNIGYIIIYGKEYATLPLLQQVSGKFIFKQGSEIYIFEVLPERHASFIF